MQFIARVEASSHVGHVLLRIERIPVVNDPSSRSQLMFQGRRHADTERSRRLFE